MPLKPKHPCNHPGCPELTSERFCPTHKRKAARKYDNTRGNSAQRGYGIRWQKLRKYILRRNPLCQCQDCRDQGRHTPADMVHHIDGNPLNNSSSNLMAMSMDCHRRLHGWTRKWVL
ncbi:MAG: HNH endonuclease [Desulfobacterales bacterium]|nr:MAG: HNH endonuclease [Desulfobacterales bacterium]